MIYMSDVAFTSLTCIECGCLFGIPTSMQEQLRESKKTFHCPNGHQQCYCAESPIAKVQRELEAERKRHADTNQAMWKAIREKDIAETEKTKLAGRIKRIRKAPKPHAACRRKQQAEAAGEG